MTIDAEASLCKTTLSQLQCTPMAAAAAQHVVESTVHEAVAPGIAHLDTNSAVRVPVGQCCSHNTAEKNTCILFDAFPANKRQRATEPLPVPASSQDTPAAIRRVLHNRPAICVPSTHNGSLQKKFTPRDRCAPHEFPRSASPVRPSAALREKREQLSCALASALVQRSPHHLQPVCRHAVRHTDARNLPSAPRRPRPRPRIQYRTARPTVRDTVAPSYVNPPADATIWLASCTTRSIALFPSHSCECEQHRDLSHPTLRFRSSRR